jgi:thiol:disulfide interchange protein
MNMQRTLLVGGVLLLVGIGGFFTFVRNDKQPVDTMTSNPKAQGVIDQGSSKDIPEDLAQDTSQPSQRYTQYSEANLAAATANGGRAVVFFHAGWCPFCKAAEANLKANLDQIPNDVTILQADFDTTSALKSKLNVVAQDTFVQVDADGNAVTAWTSGGQGVDSLLSNLQ